MKHDDNPGSRFRQLSRYDKIFLLLSGDLTDWERDFCKSCYRTDKPSEKQREWLDKIWRKYFRGG